MWYLIFEFLIALLCTSFLLNLLRWDALKRFAIVFPCESFGNQFLSICRPDRYRIISLFDWQLFSFSHTACNPIMDAVVCAYVRMQGSNWVCVCVWVCMLLCRYKKRNPIFEQHSLVCLCWALSFKVCIFWAGWAVISCPLWISSYVKGLSI